MHYYFNMAVKEEHLIPLRNGTFTFLRAMPLLLRSKLILKFVVAQVPNPAPLQVNSSPKQAVKQTGLGGSGGGGQY